MVKGISKQVILVRPQEEALFEQAIFIVRDNVADVTEAELLHQAQEAAGVKKPRGFGRSALVGFLCGGSLMGLVWGLCAIL